MMKGESVKEYMQRREFQQQQEKLQKMYRAAMNSPEANELQRKSEDRFRRAAEHWRKQCGLEP